MQFESYFWIYWYYNIPNYLLGLLFWTLCGRFLLSFLMPPDSPNYIFRFFCRVTNPVIYFLRFLTPRFLHPTFIPLYIGFFVLIFRFVFWRAMFLYGLTPPIPV